MPFRHRLTYKLVWLILLVSSCLAFLLSGCAGSAADGTQAVATAVGSEAAATATVAKPAPLASTETPSASGPALVVLRADVEDGPAEGYRLEVVVEGVRDLYGAEIHLTFDPAVARVTDSDADTPGAQIEPGPVFDERPSFVAVNLADHDQGTIDFAVTLLGKEIPLEGEIVLARLHLLPVGEGEMQIDFSRVMLANSQAAVIASETQGLTFEVKP
jgi:hypothetical protein